MIDFFVEGLRDTWTTTRLSGRTLHQIDRDPARSRRRSGWPAPAAAARLTEPCPPAGPGLDDIPRSIDAREARARVSQLPGCWCRPASPQGSATPFRPRSSIAPSPQSASNCAAAARTCACDSRAMWSRTTSQQWSHHGRDTRPFRIERTGVTRLGAQAGFPRSARPHLDPNSKAGPATPLNASSRARHSWAETAARMSTGAGRAAANCSQHANGRSQRAGCRSGVGARAARAGVSLAVDLGDWPDRRSSPRARIVGEWLP